MSAAVTASALALALYARVEPPWLILGWIGLVPWLAAVDRMRSVRKVLSAGLLMSMAFVLLVFSWLPTALQNYTGIPWIVALLVALVCAPLVEPQFVAVALARHVMNRQRRGHRLAALATAGIYVGTEWAYPKIFADTLGQGLYASVFMRQAADIAGTPGLTFALIVANSCILSSIAAAMSRRSARERFGAALAPGAVVVTLAVILLAYGAARYRQFHNSDRPGDRVIAGLVQADISNYGGLATELGTFNAVRKILDTHFTLSAELLGRAHLDLLVWPETVYPTTFGSPKSQEGAAFDREIGAFVDHTGVPLVFGAYDTDGVDEFNAAVFLEPTGSGQVSFETYRKTLLFPFTERAPRLFDFPTVRRWLPWLGTWKPGTGPQVVRLPLADGRTLRLAPLICYDALDANLALTAVRHGADLILTLSNDSWFSYDGAPRLILLIAAFDSIETRRSQLRATNTGISAVIAPTGELLDTIGLHERGTLVAGVIPERQAMTLMLLWGDWFGPVALAVGIVLLVTPWPARQLSSCI